MLEHLNQSDLDDLEYIISKNPDAIYKLYGSGFSIPLIKSIRKWLSPCLCYSRHTTKMLKQYSSDYIKTITIYRTPLAEALHIALNGISAGYWYNTMKQHGFDKFFHLALVITVLHNGKPVQLIIEKNEVINVSDRYKTSKDTEVQAIKFYKRLTLDEMLKRTRQFMGDEDYFLYDAFTNNCQYFIRAILESNGILSKRAEDFLFQNISDLVKDLPKYLRKTTRFITDTAGTITKYIG